MSFGLATFDAAGVEIFNSTAVDLAVAAAVVDSFTVSAGGAGSQQYPDYAGFVFQLVVINTYNYSDLSIYSTPSASVDYGAGYPVVSWSPGSEWYAGGATIIVLAVSAPSRTNYGLHIVSPDGILLLSEATRALKKISGAVISSGTWPGGIPGQITAFSSYLYRFTSDTPIIPMVRSSGGIFGILGLNQVSSSVWDVLVIGDVVDCVAFATQPTVECGEYGMAIYTHSGDVAWDSSYYPMVLRGTANVVGAGSASINGGVLPYLLVGSAGWRIYTPPFSSYSWDAAALWQLSGTGPTYSVSRPETWVAQVGYDRGNSSVGYGAKAAFSLDMSFY